MNKNELEELDFFIAELMEPRPPQFPLRAVRLENDDRYNVAEQLSNGGWWKCQVGTDAENKHLGSDTLCIWEPAFSPASNPDDADSRSAAMEVLKKCADKLDGYEVQIAFNLYGVGKPEKFMVCSSVRRGYQTIEETLELAICLFSKKLFGESKSSQSLVTSSPTASK